MSLRLARETLSESFPDAVPLLRQHWREIAHYQDIPLDVDIDIYAAAERNGALRIFTVRDVVDQYDDEMGGNIKIARLIGYAVFFVRHNPHYKSSLQAVQDVIYVDPKARGRFVGVRLLRYCEHELAAEGVQVIMHHTKVDHPMLGKLLARSGYEQVDVIWAKRLDVAVPRPHELVEQEA